MKKLWVLIFYLCIAGSYNCLAQNPEEEILKDLALSETTMYMDKNLEGLRAIMTHTPKTTRFYAGNGFYSIQVGWKPIDSLMTLYLNNNFYKASVNNSNYVVEISDKLAWMAYNQQIDFENDSLPSTGTKEFRTFIKDKGEWKINSIGTIDTLSYTFANMMENVENLFNATGYSFLEAQKIEEAIEVFKLNVKLYPNSWNTYDSLAEAYAAAGNKALAIENYQKSIDMNPENENGKEWLAKLKGG